MSGQLPPFHGGRLNEAVRRWGIPRDQWLDLSTGINPDGWPVPPVPPAVWQRLPEDDDGLEERIRHWAGAPDKACCVAVPGSQCAIQTLPRLRGRCRVGVPQPGYQEHGHGWRSEGHDLVAVSAGMIAAGDDWLDDLDVLVWIQPNNPSGQIVTPERLLDWHQRLAKRGGWLVVDEAFAEGVANVSVVAHTGTPGLVVLKSLGKFYGLAGLRAGAVLTDSAIAAALRNAIGPWAMNGPARYLMARVLADDAWRASTVTRLASQSERLHTLLIQAGLPPAGGTLLFRYVVTDRAPAIADALAAGGILVRRFEQPAALRFGLPGTEDDWQRLGEALRSLTN
ncbi:threonine-phosphate decarboxylase CobD [Marinobacter mobilis]|uniref:threonine-phosphate decarboxylase n=1 Tax=Marinobacter mobilis TaxID=488533 RepID=A0A1H2Y6P3_9GAMM|nr:threonine-phosphate decarboxylase CobD [Marinobacter mobilis]SDX00730.1 L-threonine O-3-phosphate decarboxylase [Marinobacter mobilis]SDX48632.1 L-threonine O-3-phosphate decarboxylase [Marinobacter mobilis]